MGRHLVGSVLNDVEILGINQNFQFLFEQKEVLDNIVKRVNSMEKDLMVMDNDVNNLLSLNEDTQGLIVEAESLIGVNNDTNERLDNIIADSGTSSTEVIDARGEHSILKNRLDSTDTALYGTPLNAKVYGAAGDGIADDTVAIQTAVDTANSEGVKKVFIPFGKYKITAPILLNGCTLEGTPGNIFGDNYIGTTIIAGTKDFTAIKQGSTKAADIQFNISDILVEGAMIGFELNYVINSTYSRLYARNCDIGYKLGDTALVGSMFNEFNNLYTSGCRIGIESDSKEFFNNNVFNNGFIQGTDYAAKISVTGGYGAINNTFNNVEFRSSMGRGIILHRARNTVLNYCYNETGGNAIRVGIASSVILNDCIYALFKKDNINKDNSFVYFEENASPSKIDGGRIYLSAENSDGYFVNTHNNYPLKRLTIVNDVSLTNSSLATNFKSYRSNYNHLLTNVKMDKFVNLKLNDQEFKRDELLKLSDFEVLNNTEIINGSEVIVTEGYWTINANLKLEIGQTPASKYFYIEKNGQNIVSQVHSFESPEKDLERFHVNTVVKCNEGDKIEFVLMYENGGSTMNITGGTQSLITLKYLG